MHTQSAHRVRPPLACISTHFHRIFREVDCQKTVALARTLISRNQHQRTADTQTHTHSTYTFEVVQGGCEVFLYKCRVILHVCA